jgi:hypothetical protein
MYYLATDRALIAVTEARDERSAVSRMAINVAKLEFTLSRDRIPVVVQEE